MRRVALTIFIIIIYFISNAQPFAISFDYNYLPVELVSSKPESQTIRFNYPGIRFFEVNTPNGVYNQMAVPGTYRSGKIGEPQLVSSQKLIAVPMGAEVKVKVLSYQKEEFQLADYTTKKQIIPYQPSVSKSDDSVNQDWMISANAYKQNSYSKQSLATIEVLGIMHGMRIAKLIINPVKYNPLANNIEFYNNIEVEITFKNSDLTATRSQMMNNFSPYFNSQLKSIIPSLNYPDNPDLVKDPVRYLIITPPNYLNSLHDFIQWKTQKGFEVIVGNTNLIGNTANQIKLWIQNQYSDTLGGKPTPSFLLLVGDIEQIPVSQIGSRTYKVTDLYYASVDGDMFPDIYCGRLPAKDTIQLKAILNKILLYEKYQFPDDSFLNDVTLIAGADPTWNPRIAQPTIQYGTENYFNTAQGFSSVNAYLSTYTGCYNNDKIGVSFINYTAHCLQTTWGNPYLTTSMVSGFSNSGKFPLVVGNCCQSGDFSINTCMGEAWIRNPNGGAIAYLGSVPDTYWYEDFYWAVGAHAPIPNSYPTVAGSSMGMYDAPFTSDYQTTDALLFAGNLAVTEAHNQGYVGDVDAKYYWEAYHCLGDPSIVPYFKKGLVQAVGHLAKLETGIGEYLVEALPGSLVTLSTNTGMLATAMIPNEGNVILYFDSNLETDSVKLVVTKPKYKPYIADIPVTVSLSSYLALKSFTFSDTDGNQNGLLDFNEIVTLKLEIENIGDSLSQNILVGVDCTDPFIHSLTHEEYSQLGPLTPGEVDSINNFFEVRVKDSVPDQHIVWFTVSLSDSISGRPRKLYSYQRQLILNAPDLKILSSLKLDDFYENGNERADKGELIALTVGFVNTGHSQVSATALLQSHSVNSLFQILDANVFLDSILPNDTIFQTYSVQTYSNPETMSDTLQFSLAGNKYQKSQAFVVPVGMESPKSIGTQETELMDYPFNNYYKNNRTQFLYTYDEIGQGINQITALGFNLSAITANVAYRDLSNFKINILETNAQELSGFIDMGKAQMVFSQPLYYLPNVTGWQSIQLQQPFLMTKTSNLVIEILWGTTDNFAPIADRCKIFGSASAFNSVAFGYHNSTNPPSLNGVSKMRPNLQLIYDSLGILTIEVVENPPLFNLVAIEGCKLSIGSQTFTTNELGRTKYFSNQSNELLQIYANAFGYRDTSFNWLKTELYSHLNLQMEKNPILIVEVKNRWDVPIASAEFVINGFSFLSNHQGILECVAAKKGTFNTYTIEKQGFHSITDSIELNGITDTLKLVLMNDYADAMFQVTNTKMQAIQGAFITIDGELYITDSTGSATASDLILGEHSFTINAQDYVGQTGFFNIQYSDTLLLINLQSVGKVQFLVTDGFLPLKQVTIDFNGIVKLTDSFGKVNFEQMVEGYYSWMASKKGYFETTGTISAYGDFTHFEIALKSIPDITFYVYNGYTSLSEVEIRLNDSIYYTDSDGLLKIFDIEVGTCNYSVSKESYETITGSFNMSEMDTSIAIKLQSIPDLGISVSDEKGNLEGAVVKINSDSLITNSLGEVLFVDLGKGIFSMEVSCQGYHNSLKEVTLSNLDTIVIVQLTKIPDITWHTSHLGQPIDSVVIQFSGSEYLTDIFGTLHISDIDNGTYAYQISKSGYVEIDSLFVVDDSDQMVTHELEKLSELTFIVTDASNDPIPDVMVSFELGTFFTDSVGKANFQGIRKGLYHYLLSKEGYLSVSDSILINSDEMTEIALLIVESFRIQFEVFNAENNPLQEAQITFIGETRITDSSGTVSWNSVLPNHAYNYQVYKQGYFLVSGEVTITNSNWIERVILEIETFDVTFKVSDGNGVVSSASVTFDNKVKSTSSTGEAIFYNIVPLDSMGYIVRKLDSHITNTNFISLHSDTLINVFLLAISLADQGNGEFSVFPNPTHGKILLIGNQNFKGMNYQVYNALGTLVVHGSLESTHSIIDLSNQNQGFYYLYLKFQNSFQIFKIFKD